MMEKNKYFIITVDTEEDNQWNINSLYTVENIKYLPRFQQLAEKYNFKPVWLTTYKMATSKEFIRYFKKKQDDHLCEIGAHIHAWNNPPFYRLNHVTNQKSYLIEYPIDIMDEKVRILTKTIEKNFGKRPVSHRSGRWSINDIYINILKKYHYKVDCSYTPGVNWSKFLGESGMPGTDYRNSCKWPFHINGILEVPMTIRKIHYIDKNKMTSIKKIIREIQLYIIGRKQWMRPDSTLLDKGLMKLFSKCSKENYIMFMIHSSELMPGGSPNFKSKESIDRLYIIIEKIFKYAKDLGYVGITLEEYYNNHREDFYV